MTLRPATLPNRERYDKKMVITRDGHSEVFPANHWWRVLRRTDVLVYNNSSVLPARFAGTHPLLGYEIELRLAQSLGESPADRRSWLAAIWKGFTSKMVTEQREAVADLQTGDTVPLSRAKARIVQNQGSGLYSLTLEPEAGEVLTWMLREGRPIQYAYLDPDLRLWDIQTPFAGPAWSLEAPSAGFLFDWETRLELQRLGIRMVPIAHAAGLSSWGNAVLDARLPLGEWSRISADAAIQLNKARQNGHRLIALGTTVARCLEAAWRRGGGSFDAETFRNGLILGPNERAMAIAALVTGLHESNESHFSLEQSLISREEAESALKLAASAGLRHHEYGDFHYLERRNS
jgi:S-adenosylmethionine:tRNA ribosyltransferase-isomerase